MDRQKAIERILESEDLTDNLDDDAADWLLNWATSKVDTLLSVTAQSEQSDEKVNQLMRVMRQLNQMMADYADAAAEEMAPEIETFLAQYAETFGITRAQTAEDYQQVAADISEKQPTEAIQALIAFAQPDAAAASEAAPSASMANAPVTDTSATNAPASDDVKPADEIDDNWPLIS
jgi:hypothetical protein